jgi:hypothetical protein
MSKSTEDDVYLKLVSTYEQCSQRIQQLQAKLEKEIQYRKCLERKIGAIRTCKNIPVLKLPQELIVRIFELVMLDDPRDIQRVLPVCKHWYNTATQYPYLWNRIDIRPNWDINDIERLTKYVSCALRRSRGLPLDVTVFSRNSPRLRDTVVEVMASAISPERETIENITSWFWDVIDLPVYDSPPFTVWQKKYESVLNQLGEHLHRWRSITLDIDAEEDLLFFNFFSDLRSKGEATALQCVTFLGDTFVDYDELSLPIAPSLKSINIPADHILDIAISDPSQLHDIRTTFVDFHQISLMRNLRLLYIRPAWRFQDRQMQQVFLPSLEELSLHGQFNQAIINAFNVPQLRILRLIDETNAESIDDETPLHYTPFNRVSRLHLLNLPSLTGPKFLQVMKQLLKQFRYLESLTIPRWDERETLIALYDLQRDDLCAKTLRYVNILATLASGEKIDGSSALFWKTADDFVYGTRCIQSSITYGKMQIPALLS